MVAARIVVLGVAAMAEMEGNQVIEWKEFLLHIREIPRQDQKLRPDFRIETFRWKYVIPVVCVKTGKGM